MSRSTLRAATLVGVLVFLGACNAPPYPAFSIENDSEAYASVVVQDPSLRSSVRAGKPVVRRVADNCLHVLVPIRNVEDEDITVLAQISYRDRQHEPLGDESPRQVLTIAPGGTVNFESTSRSDAADDYVVRLFWGNR